MLKKEDGMPGDKNAFPSSPMRGNAVNLLDVVSPPFILT
jgi:hypothetical protein